MRRLEVRPDPLPESRWEAIESKVFAHIDATPLPSRRPRAAVGRTTWMAITAALVFATGAALGARPWLRPVAPSPAPVAVDQVTHLTVGDSALDVSPGAVVAVRHDEVSLTSGTVDFGVPPRGSASAFVVTTPHARVESEGAKFRVDVVPTQTEVVVSSGTTRTIASDVAHPVNAGETWTSATAVPPAPSSTALSIPTSGIAPPPSTARALSPQAQFELAESLESADPDRAAAQYDALAKSGGPWADNALFAEGRLQADRGRRDDAKRLLTEYLARYPNGPNAVDARALLERQSP